MGVHETYWDNHFVMRVSQIIMLHTLNLYSAICQLYLNKTRRKIKKKKNKKKKPNTCGKCVLLFYIHRKNRKLHTKLLTLIRGREWEERLCFYILWFSLNCYQNLIFEFSLKQHRT